MVYDIKKRRVDKGFIKIRENTKVKNDCKNDRKNDYEKQDFCFKMYHDWTYMNNPVDIPVLIMDNFNLSKNKDVDIIPRLYSKYNQKKIKIPFVYCNNKYRSLNKYFYIYLKKDIPNVNDFKNFLMEKKDLEENQELYESINIFLYTSFLLKQFSTVMKITEHFYSPITDETKYYFYILFDYMRRNCIKNNIPLMKNEVIELIRKIATLDNKVLTNELFLTTFTFIDKAIFENNNKFYLINKNDIFNYTLTLKEGDTGISSTTNEVDTRISSITNEVDTGISSTI